jgi:hypothetical protein
MGGEAIFRNLANQGRKYKFLVVAEEKFCWVSGVGVGGGW